MLEGRRIVLVEDDEIMGESIVQRLLLEGITVKWWRSGRDAIKEIIAAGVKTMGTAHWLALLQPADIWCAEVMDWPGLMASDAFGRLKMVQHISGATASLDTLRGPLRIDGAVPSRR